MVNEHVGFTLDVLPGTMAGITAAMGGFNELVAATSVFATAIGRSTSVVDSMILTLGVGLVGAAWESAKAFGEVERSMKIVQAVSGQTSSEISVLTQKANEFSVKYKMGIDDMTAGLQTLGRAGLSSVNTQIDTLQAGLQAAKTQGIALDDALNKIVQTTSLLGGDINASNFGQQAQDLTSKILATAMSAPIDMNDVVQTLSYSGGTAAAAGINIQNPDALYDYLGAVSSFAQKGVTGSMAGTAMRAFFTKPASQDTSVVEALNKLDMKASDLWEAGGNKMRPVSEQIGLIHQQMDKLHMSTLDQIELWGKIVGPKMGQQMMKLDENAIKNNARSIRETASAEDLAATTMKNFMSELEELSQRGQKTWREYGNTAIAWIEPVIRSLNTLYDTVGSWNVGGIPIIQQFVKAGIIIIISQVIQKLGNVWNLFKNIAAELKNILATGSQNTKTTEQLAIAEQKRLQSLGLTEEQAKTLTSEEGKLANNLSVSNKVLAEFLTKLNEAVSLMRELANLSRIQSMGTISRISAAQHDRYYSDIGTGLAKTAWSKKYDGNVGHLTRNEFAQLSLRHGIPSHQLESLYYSSQFQQFAQKAQNQSDKQYKFANAISLEKYLQENQQGMYDPELNPLMGVVSQIKTDTGNIAAQSKQTPVKSKTDNEPSSTNKETNKNTSKNKSKSESDKQAKEDEKQTKEKEKQTKEEEKQTKEKSKKTKEEDKQTKEKEKQARKEQRITELIDKTHRELEASQQRVLQTVRQQELQAAKQRAGMLNAQTVTPQEHVAKLRTARASLVAAENRLATAQTRTTEEAELNQRRIQNIRAKREQISQKIIAEEQKVSEENQISQKLNDTLGRIGYDIDEEYILRQDILALTNEYKARLEYVINSLRGTNTQADYLRGSFTNRNIKRRNPILTSNPTEKELAAYAAQSDKKAADVAAYQANNQALNRALNTREKLSYDNARTLTSEQLKVEQEVLTQAKKELAEEQKLVYNKGQEVRESEATLVVLRQKVARLEAERAALQSNQGFNYSSSKFSIPSSRVMTANATNDSRYNDLNTEHYYNVGSINERIEKRKLDVEQAEASLASAQRRYNTAIEGNLQRIAYYEKQIELTEGNIETLTKLNEAATKQIATNKQVHEQALMQKHANEIRALEESIIASQSSKALFINILERQTAELGIENNKKMALEEQLGVEQSLLTAKQAMLSDEIEIQEKLPQQLRDYTRINSLNEQINLVKDGIRTKEEELNNVLTNISKLTGQAERTEKIIFGIEESIQTQITKADSKIIEFNQLLDARNLVIMTSIRNLQRASSTLLLEQTARSFQTPKTTPGMTLGNNFVMYNELAMRMGYLLRGQQPLALPMPLPTSNNLNSNSLGAVKGQNFIMADPVLTKAANMINAQVPKMLALPAAIATETSSTPVSKNVGDISQISSSILATTNKVRENTAGFIRMTGAWWNPNIKNTATIAPDINPRTVYNPNFALRGGAYNPDIPGMRQHTSGILQLEQTAQTFQTGLRYNLSSMANDLRGKFSTSVNNASNALRGLASRAGAAYSSTWLGQKTSRYTSGIAGFGNTVRASYITSLEGRQNYNPSAGFWRNWATNSGMSAMVNWGAIRNTTKEMGLLGKVAGVAGGALGSFGMMFGPAEVAMMGFSLVMQGIQQAQQKYQEELEKINSRLSEAREDLEKAEESFASAYEEQNPNATQEQKDQAYLNLYLNGEGDRDDGLDSYRANVQGALNKIEINTREKAKKENDFWFGAQGGAQKGFWSHWDEFWGTIFDNSNITAKNELGEQFDIAAEGAKATNEYNPSKVNSAQQLETTYQNILGTSDSISYRLDYTLSHYENWIDDLEDYSSQAKYATALINTGMDSTGASGGSDFYRAYGDYGAKTALSQNGINDYRAFEKSLAKIPASVQTQITNSINEDPDFYKRMQRQMFSFKDNKLQRTEGNEVKILQAIRKRVGNITTEQAKQTLILSTISSIHDFVQNQIQPTLMANVESSMQGVNTLGLTNTSVGYTGSTTSAVHQGVMNIIAQLGTLIEQKALENMSLLSESAGINFKDLNDLARAYDKGDSTALPSGYNMSDAGQARKIMDTMMGMYAGTMVTKGMSQEEAYKYAQTKFGELYNTKTINGKEFTPEITDMMRTWEKWFTPTMTPYVEEQWAKSLTDRTGTATGPESTGKDKSKDKDKDSSSNRKNWVNLAICNKKEIPKLNVNLFKKPPNFTILNRNFKLRDVNVNTADDAKSIQNAVKNSIIEIQNRSNPKIIQDDAAEYDPVNATDGNTLPVGTKKTE